MTLLTITRGDDETLTVLVTDPDNDNAPVDLTGSLLTFMVKVRVADADDDALITKTLGSGITLSDQTTDTGQATIELDATDTEPLTPGHDHWELQGIDSSGEVKTFAGGLLRVLADLIRA